jgi:hypothetical protein
MGAYTGEVSTSYTIFGSGLKTAHLLMDGREFMTREIATSG